MRRSKLVWVGAVVLTLIVGFALLFQRSTSGGPLGEQPETIVEQPAVEEASHVDAMDSAWSRVTSFASESHPVSVLPAVELHVDDSEWALLMRTDERIFAQMVTRPNSIRPAALFRNVLLNPRDTYLAGDTRSILGITLEPCRAELTKVLDGFAAFVSAELDDLVKLGQYRVLTMETLSLDEVNRLALIRRDLFMLKQVRRVDSGPSLAESPAPTVSDIEVLIRLAVDAGMLYRVIDGRVCIVERSRLTRSAAQAALIREIMRTHAVGVIEWFLHQGALSTGEVNDLLKEVDVDVEKALVFPTKG